ncbi:MAG TPA: hypothetical protein VGE29_14910 [Prosthecobacter sp.]
MILADWVLIGLIALASVATEWMIYLSGLYWTPWFLPWVATHIVILALWVTLIFMPAIHPVSGRLALRLVVRVGLITLGAFAWSAPLLLWRPAVPPYVQGCERAFQKALTETDFAEIRTYAARHLADDPTRSALFLQPQDWPKNFARLNRPEPEILELHGDKASQKREIQIHWGSALTGHHGLFIDPDQTPDLGPLLTVDGRFMYQSKLAEGVYFFATSD